MVTSWWRWRFRAKVRRARRIVFRHGLGKALILLQPVSSSAAISSGLQPGQTSRVMSKIYDHAGSLRRMGNDYELFQEMVGLLKSDAPHLLEILSAAHRE